MTPDLVAAISSVATDMLDQLGPGDMPTEAGVTLALDLLVGMPVLHTFLAEQRADPSVRVGTLALEQVMREAFHEWEAGAALPGLGRVLRLWQRLLVAAYPDADEEPEPQPETLAGVERWLRLVRDDE